MERPSRLARSSNLGVRLCAAVVLPSIAGIAAADQAEPNAQASKETFILFQPGSVDRVEMSPDTFAKIQHDTFRREFLSSRWVRPNVIAVATARPGDRVLVEVNEQETFEVELTAVNVVEGHAVWHARFPGVPGETFNALFSRPKGSNRPSTLTSASLTIPSQGRQISVSTAEELPGYALMREVKLGTGTDLEHGDDTGGPAWRERARLEVEQAKRDAPKRGARTESQLRISSITFTPLSSLDAH